MYLMTLKTERSEGEMGMYPKRKKPCIVVREGNETTILGTFKNIGDAEFLVDKLAELTNAKESEQ